MLPVLLLVVVFMFFSQISPFDSMMAIKFLGYIFSVRMIPWLKFVYTRSKFSIFELDKKHIILLITDEIILVAVFILLFSCLCKVFRGGVYSGTYVGLQRTTSNNLCCLYP